ncbi:MAG: bifunctional phosphopantothenoylcysteine decarboxylase/phosphopantothenate--cysteine ligase CoaBC [Flavobacteriales bacterium]
MLKGKKILLGITGSIAAYKSILLVRELVKLGAQVKVVCTTSALDFVTPLTLSTVSKNPVHSSFVSNPQTGEWVNHVALGKWADLMIIAPLSASSLSKLVSGQCDNLLLVTYLSATCPVMVAPAMDLDMYAHWTTQENLNKLKSKGVQVIEAEEGELASGLVGQGRMAEPEHIIKFVEQYFQGNGSLAGKRILVTAGPTYEMIDPVRFIGNFSSGKMGYAIANEAASRGARVVLISGPVHGVLASDGVDLVDVTSAEDMLNAVLKFAGQIDIFIMAAAVADYRPKIQFDQKQKKEGIGISKIELEETKDILKTIGTQKNGAKVIGFALETENEIENARRKLRNKNADMIVLNSLNDLGAGFGTETNKVTFVFDDMEVVHSLKSKAEVAKDILNAIENL